MIVEKLSSCPKCTGDIFPQDVYKTVPIQQSPQHVALVYKCPRCGTKSRAVATAEDWEDRRVKATKRKTNLRAEQIELDAVESVDDLVALWASYKNPPIREEVMFACMCPQCVERLYG
jgi:uncharacterized Zn finger protein